MIIDYLFSVLAYICLHWKIMPISQQKLLCTCDYKDEVHFTTG